MSERTHRHELEKNILAKWISETAESLKPYATHLTIAGVVVVGVVIAAVVYYSQGTAPGARGWEAFLTAYGEGEEQTTEALKDAAEKADVKGTQAEIWSLLAFADRKFAGVAFQSAQDPETKATLAEAQSALEKVEALAKDAALIRCRFNLAKVYEAQNKPEQAREYYQKVAETAKDTAIGKAAAEGVKRLDPQGEAVPLIAWLAEQKPPERGKSGAGESPFLRDFGPGFGSSFGGGAPPLPERPNLDLPGTSLFSGGSELDFGRDDPLGLKGASLAPADDDAKTKAPATDAKEEGQDDKPAPEESDSEKTNAEKP